VNLVLVVVVLVGLLQLVVHLAEMAVMLFLVLVAEVILLQLEQELAVMVVQD
jgi:hypothetical protein